jgi:hypothetical protein
MKNMTKNMTYMTKIWKTNYAWINLLIAENEYARRVPPAVTIVDGLPPASSWDILKILHTQNSKSSTTIKSFGIPIIKDKALCYFDSELAIQISKLSLFDFSSLSSKSQKLTKNMMNMTEIWHFQIFIKSNQGCFWEVLGIK